MYLFCPNWPRNERVMAKIHLPCTHRGSAAPLFQLSSFFGFDADFTLSLCTLYHLSTTIVIASPVTCNLCLVTYTCKV